MSRFTQPYGTTLVYWELCWIRASLLEQLRKAVAKLDDPELQEDIRAELAEKCEGKELLTAEDLPPKIKRILKL